MPIGADVDSLSDDDVELITLKEPKDLPPLPPRDGILLKDDRINSNFKDMVCNPTVTASHFRYGSNPLSPNTVALIPKSTPIFVNYTSSQDTPTQTQVKTPLSAHGIPVQPSPQKTTASSPGPSRTVKVPVSPFRRHTLTQPIANTASPLLKSQSSNVPPSIMAPTAGAPPSPIPMKTQKAAPSSPSIIPSQSMMPKSGVSLFRASSSDTSSQIFSTSAPELRRTPSISSTTAAKFRRMTEEEQFENDEKMV